VEVVDSPVWDGKVVIPLNPRLGSSAVRRLQRLQSEVDGATAVAQAAINVHQAKRDAYQAAFLSACEDADIDVPHDGPYDVDIDWSTGEVRFIAK
jgi:hypothetical protein